MYSNTAIPMRDVTQMMQAIIKIANGQFESSVSLKSLENRVEALESVPEETLAKMFKEYMMLAPEELTLANTMGYTYGGAIEVMSMKEIKARLYRLNYLFNISASFKWRTRVLNAIGKTLVEVRMEAQAFNIKNGIPTVIKTLYDAVEAIHEYLKWGTVVLLELEQQYGICKNMYTKYEIFHEQNQEFNERIINTLPPNEFEEWLIRRCKDISTMLNCSISDASTVIHKVLSFEINKRKGWRNYKEACDKFTYNPVEDFKAIISDNTHDQLRSLCVYVIKNILVI